jgi:hypothetical protein
MPAKGAPMVLAGSLALLLGAGCAGSLSDPGAFAIAGSEDAGVTVEAGVGSDASEASAAPSCPDVPSLFVKSCGESGCHDAKTQAQGLDLVSPGVASRLVGVTTTEGTGLLIDPGAPSQSVVYTKLLASPPFGARMPTGAPLDDATIACVLTWVTAQAAVATKDAGVVDSGSGRPDASDAGSGTVAFTPLRVAAGQTTPVTDAQQQTWAADTDFTNGTAAVETTQVAIANTDAPALYNGQRYGNPSFSYTFTVPDGAYTVTLKFAELYVTGPGMRLFDVAINGTTVESAFDIYAAAGAMNTAVDRTYPVMVEGGAIQIDFLQGSIQFPKVDAIQIVQSAPDGGP